MQIAEKYQKEYEESLHKIKKARVELCEALNRIHMLRVFPSQGNYVTVQLVNGITAKELTKRLFINHNILIKDLSGRVDGKELVRLTVKKAEDNERLLKVLTKELIRK